MRRGRSGEDRQQHFHDGLGFLREAVGRVYDHQSGADEPIFGTEILAQEIERQNIRYEAVRQRLVELGNVRLSLDGIPYRCLLYTSPSPRD